MTVDREPPQRLADSADADARELVRSSRIDAPGAGVREVGIARVLAGHRQQRRQKRLFWAAASSALGLAALAALWVRSNRTPEAALTREVRPAPTLLASGLTPPTPSSQAPELEACTPAMHAEGSEPLIDDFEDADTRIALLEHRAGFWSASNDSTGTQLPSLRSPFTMSRIPGGRAESHFALRSSGSKFFKWGAVVSTELSSRRCYDASAYAGITFWARGHGTLNFVAKMTQVAPEEYGGSCKHDCYDGHRAVIALGKQWQEHRILWADLRQKGFGQPIPFDPHSLLSLELGVTPDQTPFDFWVDDIRFVKR